MSTEVVIADVIGAAVRFAGGVRETVDGLPGCFCMAIVVAVPAALKLARVCAEKWAYEEPMIVRCVIPVPWLALCAWTCWSGAFPGGDLIGRLSGLIS